MEVAALCSQTLEYVACDIMTKPLASEAMPHWAASACRGLCSASCTTSHCWGLKVAQKFMLHFLVWLTRVMDLPDVSPHPRCGKSESLLCGEGLNHPAGPVFMSDAPCGHLWRMRQFMGMVKAYIVTLYG